MSTISTALVTNGKFSDLIQRSLAIRYTLIPSGALMVRILGGRWGHFDRSTALISAFCFEQTIHLGSEFKDCHFRLNWIEGPDKVPGWLHSVLLEWETKTKDYPWWGDWLEPKPFVGMFVHGDNVRTELPENHPNFLFYHGVLAQFLARYSKELEQTQQTTESYRNAFSVLAARFGTFAAQTQHSHMAQTFGARKN